MKRRFRKDSQLNAALKLCLFVLAMTGLLGCSERSESQEDDSAEGYPLVGEVLEVHEAEGTLEVRHEEISGYMPAMTMRFEVSEGDLKNARPGQRIRARLVRGDAGEFRLIKLWPLDEEASRDLKRYNALLQKQTRALSSGRYYGEGDASPDFALLNQYGEVVSSERLKGAPFFLNFIFTRCTDAKMCPMSTFKMAQLQSRVKEEGMEALFVSITLDPEFDTPGVLRSYAETYQVDGESFYFVTGPKPAVANLIKSLGVTSIEQADTLMHSLTTLLVDKNGKIVKRSESSAWSVEAFLEALKEIAD